MRRCNRLRDNHIFSASDSSETSSSSESSNSSGSDEDNSSRTKEEMMNKSRDSDDDATSEECTKMKVDKPKVLRTKIKTKTKERVKARGPGANRASRQRNLDYAKCGLVKMWIVATGCGYDLVPKREVALMKRFVEKAKHTITFHTANVPTVTGWRECVC